MGMSTAKKATRQIERLYLKRDRQVRYIACEEYDFTWSTTEISAFRKMWEEGTPLDRISVALQRHNNEVFILALDQAEKGKIETRPGWIYGVDTKKGRV